jgi:NAD(P)-dependent dehydrogenase (short-subunit alcohol dehydrogenase family)
MSADYSSFGLMDKIAVVTGASQGIGKAIALGLANAGAHLVLAKHPQGRQEEIQQVKAEIEKMGRKAIIVLTDVNDVKQVQALMDKAKETFGRIDILVNNASWTGTGPALGVTEEEYDKTMTACVRACFLPARRPQRS